MRWQQGRRSRNIEDRRGSGGARGGKATGRAGSGMGFLMTAGLVVAGLIFGVNPMKLINMTGGLGGLTGGGGGALPGSGGGVQYDASANQNDQAGQFVSSILGYTEDTWKGVYRHIVF